MYIIMHSYLGNRWRVDCLVRQPLYSASVHIGYEALWAPDLVWTLESGQTSAPVGN
jgi:hypothetical protein